MTGCGSAGAARSAADGCFERLPGFCTLLFDVTILVAERLSFWPARLVAEQKAEKPVFTDVQTASGRGKSRIHSSGARALMLQNLMSDPACGRQDKGPTPS
ncbi:MAG: hypothetical protein DMG39_28545 [Acidobacteria bacterium]|nr:MAG: hypothetical protein DMG39_28545 [Acidobacteriota bacterium]